MYKVSYEKCVCFIFLVILAVLSCSGFRIDNLAMTDISKKNSSSSIIQFFPTQQRSNSSTLNTEETLNKLLFNNNGRAHHKIRHHRTLRLHQQYHDISINRPSTTQSSQPLIDQKFAQLPSTLLPTRSISPETKSQKSYNNDGRSRNHRKQCQEEDIPWKSYMANTIVIAKAESMRSEKNNYTVIFKVLEKLKYKAFKGDFATLVFTNKKTNCDYDDANHKSQKLVKAKIEQSKQYVLFLDAYSDHNYSAVGAPEPAKNKVLKQIQKVEKKRLVPARVDQLIDNAYPRKTINRKRLKLVCKVGGFPIPRIFWKRNDVYLHSNKSVRISYKNDEGDRRKSTLVIKNPSNSDWGKYECVARGVNNSSASKEIHVSSTSKPSELATSGTEVCLDEKYKKEFCQNGGTCFRVNSMGVYGCICAQGFKGERCQEKSSDQSSMYEQPYISTCNTGLYTKYDNC